MLRRSKSVRIEIMLDGGDDALGGGFAGDVAAYTGDVAGDFRYGVGGAGETVGDVGLEHREVVEIIAGGEGEFRIHAGAAPHFEEGGALVVAGVIEAQPNVIALVAEFRPFL